MPRDFEDHCWKDVVSAQTLEIYAAYARELRIGERPALLAIDLYNLVYEGGPRPVAELVKDYPSSCGEYAWAAIAPTQRLFAAVRAAGIPVIYSTADPNRLVRSTNRRVSRAGERAYDIRAEFAPQPGDAVIRKQRASVFYGTPLLAHLNRLGVRSLIVCGESTSGCVRASVVDGYSNGYHVTLVEECVYDRHLLSHKVNLFDMHHKYADVMALEDVLLELHRLPVAG